MNTISNHQALSEYIKGTSVIVDVRESSEFTENHIPGALNLPSTTYDASFYRPFADRKICLVCQSGIRSSQIAKKLVEDGFSDVYQINSQMDSIKSESLKVIGWTIDRQFRMSLGVLLAIFLIGYFNGIEWLIGIPIILATGLIITSIINRCYMRMGIALLPWNRGKKV